MTQNRIIRTLDYNTFHLQKESGLLKMSHNFNVDSLIWLFFTKSKNFYDDSLNIGILFPGKYTKTVFNFCSGVDNHATFSSSKKGSIKESISGHRENFKIQLTRTVI